MDATRDRGHLGRVPRGEHHGVEGAVGAGEDRAELGEALGEVRGEGALAHDVDVQVAHGVGGDGPCRRGGVEVGESRRQ